MATKDLNLDAEEVQVNPSNKSAVSVFLKDVQISEILNHFTKDEIIDNYENDALLDGYDIDFVMKELGLVDKSELEDAENAIQELEKEIEDLKSQLEEK